MLVRTPALLHKPAIGGIVIDMVQIFKDTIKIVSQVDELNNKYTFLLDPEKYPIKA